MSHYLKVLMDAVFDPRNFRNEIVWLRTGAKSLSTRRLATNHDILLLYGKSDQFTPWSGPVEMGCSFCESGGAGQLRASAGCVRRAGRRSTGCRAGEILDSLHDRFRLLTGGARTAVRRQQTLLGALFHAGQPTVGWCRGEANDGKRWLLDERDRLSEWVPE